MERGIALSQQYGVDHLLQPIFEYVPTQDSPPLAPKHIVAAPMRAKRKVDGVESSPVRGPKRAAAVRREVIETESEPSVHHEETSRSISPTPTERSSLSQTPSPIGSSVGSEFGGASTAHGADIKRRRETNPGMMVDVDQYATAETDGGLLNGQHLDATHAALLHPSASLPAQGPARYARLILDYFVSESTQIPAFLISPPPDFDPNVVIDDDGHTALHWACAMGRIRIVKLLLSAGADIFRANAEGQTALMRSVMFTNNYDLRKFPELFELLHRSTINIDRHDRTVFHYIVDVALHKGKPHAARYYMETALNRLTDYPREVADILNFQDDEGETALTLAARARGKRLVKLLMDSGASFEIRNNDGKSAEDYIVEDEHFRASSLGPTGIGGLGAGPQTYTPHLHNSETAQRASGTIVPQVAEMLESLATSFDAELEDKERDLAQAHVLLGNIQAEILESQRTVTTLKDQALKQDEVQNREVTLQAELNEKMGKRFRLGWEKYVRDEEEREKGARAAGGILPPDLNDLIALPEAPNTIPSTVIELRAEIEGSRVLRRDLFDNFVSLQAHTGTGAKMGDLRKLIALGCGLPIAEIDAAVPALVEALEQEALQAA